MDYNARSAIEKGTQRNIYNTKAELMTRMNEEFAYLPRIIESRACVRFKRCREVESNQRAMVLNKMLPTSNNRMYIIDFLRSLAGSLHDRHYLLDFVIFRFISLCHHIYEQAESLARRILFLATFRQY